MNIVIGLAMLLVGILFCTLKSELVGALLSTIGALLIIAGIMSLIYRKWAVGTMLIAIGIVTITCGWTIADIALMLLGIALSIYAIYTLTTHISLFKRAKAYDKVYILLKPIMSFALGVILIVAKWYMVDALFIVLGTLTIVFGIVLMLENGKNED